MPTIEYISGTVTTNLNNGSPFRLTNSDDLFNFASVRRLKERGPSQHGHTDLGGRLDAPTITLQLDFHASGGSALDGYRDTLRRTFPANPGSPSYLRYTRDDGEVRQIDVYRVGPVGIPADVGQRAAKLHRAVVQVEAPGATWYDPTQAAGTINLSPEWWLAYNTIGSASVLNHAESPAQGAAWGFAGTVAKGSPWLIALRSGQQAFSAPGTVRYAFMAGTVTNDHDWHTFSAGAEYNITIGASAERLSIQGTSIMQPGTHNYFIYHTGLQTYAYRGVTLLGQSNFTGSNGSANVSLVGGSAVWRNTNGLVGGTVWQEALPRVAFYSIAPTPTQLAALNDAMTTGGTVLSTSVTYEGDWQEFPVIRINGPITNPILTNTATGETLDFTGYTIGSADWYEIDTRYGYKTVRNSGGDNKIGELTSDSDLETFHLAPDQEAAGGVNVISLAGTATGTATTAVITYYNRYTGP